METKTIGSEIAADLGRQAARESTADQPRPKPFDARPFETMGIRTLKSGINNRRPIFFPPLQLDPILLLPPFYLDTSIPFAKRPVFHGICGQFMRDQR